MDFEAFAETTQSAISYRRQPHGMLWAAYVIETARGSGGIRNVAVKRSALPRARQTDPLAAAYAKEELKNRYDH